VPCCCLAEISQHKPFAQAARRCHVRRVCQACKEHVATPLLLELSVGSALLVLERLGGHEASDSFGKKAATLPQEKIVTSNFAEPYSFYRKLRMKVPVCWDPILHVWTLTRYEDIVAALANPGLSSQRPRPTLLGLPVEVRASAAAVFDTVDSWLLRSDAPGHTRLKRITAPVMRECVALDTREKIQRKSDELLDRAAESKGMDVIEDFAASLALDAIAMIIGVPLSDRNRFREWAGAVGSAVETNPDSARIVLAYRSLAATDEYLRELLVRRMKRPERDLVSLLAAHSTRERLRVDETIGIATLVLLAGHETVTHLIGNGILALLDHPDQLERLRATPKLWPSAIQELMRYTSPLHGLLRTATHDLSVAGTLLRSGDRVAICIAAGNRDPDRFRDPERFDISRTPNPHLALGSGAHYCLGASLGSLIAEIAIRGIVERFPRLRLASQHVKWRGNYLFRSQRSLQVLF
jgi:cytochrome P450